MSEKHSPVEKIKKASRGLRGTIVKSLADEITGAIADDDQAVIKFHGMYQQDDRDVREERASKKLERLYSFMIRLRLPGGFLKPAQWVSIDEIADKNSTGVIKITSRQTIQLHGLIKSKIKPTIQAFSLAKLDSIATCGDINRNVLCSSHPKQSAIHAKVFAYADKISELLMPKTRAYYEIWLNDEQLLDKREVDKEQSLIDKPIASTPQHYNTSTPHPEEDPLYQDRYLPRKFKIAIAIPPNNDVDVFANDIGLIAIVENSQLLGFNIAIGGGLSATHGNKETYPRLATVIGFCNTEEKTLKTVYEVLTIQRDYGNRSDRKLARLKYTVDKYGVDWFTKELQLRTGFPLEKARPYQFTQRTDYFGWHESEQGLWHYTVRTENGRVLDTEDAQLRTAFLEIAKSEKANFRFTCNQNLILADIEEKNKKVIDEVLNKYGIAAMMEKFSSLRNNSMACVALNTCPLALAEGQRYLPKLISKIEPLLKVHRLEHHQIVIRMTGCPNGCARPYLAEIGLVGTSYGHYNLHLGGDRQGQRLNKIYKKELDEAGILLELDGWFGRFQAEQKENETFGDFAWRVGW